MSPPRLLSQLIMLLYEILSPPCGVPCSAAFEFFKAAMMSACITTTRHKVSTKQISRIHANQKWTRLLRVLRMPNRQWNPADTK